MSLKEIDLDMALKEILTAAEKEKNIKGREIHSIHYLDEYTRYRPEDGSPWVWLAQCLENIFRIDDAETALKKALKYLPGNRRGAIYVYLGLLYFQYKNPKIADKWFELGLTSFSKSEKDFSKGNIWTFRGACWAKLEKYEKALECFRKALRFKDTPKDEVLSNKGNVLMAMGNYKDASEVFKNILKIDPLNHRARTILFGLKEMQLNLKAFKSILTKNSTSEENLDKLFLTIRDLNKKESHEAFSIEILKFYLEKRPNHWQAWYFYGKSWYWLSCKRPALVALKRALKNCPSSYKAYVYYDIAKVYEHFNSRKVAEKWYQLASKNTKTFYPKMWMEGGKNFLILGNFEQAQKCFNKVIRSGSSSTENSAAMENMGYALRAKGKYYQSIKAFQESITLYNKNKNARIALKGLDGIKKTISQCQALKRIV